MQTFLTRYGVMATARDLDPKRLFKQVVEAKQIAMYYMIEDQDYPQHHPATIMWSGHEHFLLNYGASMAYVAANRDDMTTKQRDAAFTMLTWFASEQRQFRADFPEVTALMPAWMKSKEFILSHRSNLVRKDEGLYRPLFPSVDPDRPYLWPIAGRDGSFRYYLSAAEARRVDPAYLPSNWTVDWTTREVTFS